MSSLGDKAGKKERVSVASHSTGKDNKAQERGGPCKWKEVSRGLQGQSDLGTHRRT